MVKVPLKAAVKIWQNTSVPIRILGDEYD
jgi:hypothetical protein